MRNRRLFALKPLSAVFWGLGSLMLPAAAAAQASLPSEWEGRWEGNCSVDPPAEGMTTFGAALAIKPAEGTNENAWTLTYLYPSRSETRDYRLVPARDLDATHFVLDERNGLLLDTYLLGGDLFSTYFINGSLFIVSYQLRPDRLTMTNSHYGQAPVRRTCVSGASSLCVDALQLLGRQDCSLTRAKAH